MWRDTRFAGVVFAVSLLGISVARAGDESAISLADGEGAPQVRAMCAICHSLDYIQMNSPFQDAAGWEKTATKMIRVMGAPIGPEDAALIVGYLARNYGKEPGK
jgi:hypothetical protein